MGLMRMVWGGQIYDAAVGGQAVEIWSCSLSLLTGAAPDPQAALTPISNLLVPLHESGDSGIHTTVNLEWLKINAYDVATGKQITDPTVERVYDVPHRGGAAQDNPPPLTTACRVSIDDGSRSARRRGGFFIPRYAFPVQNNGRYLGQRQGFTVAKYRTFLNDLNGVTDVTVGVWSRKYAEVAAVTRIRVGDVPDNISTRKNALPETYSTLSVTP